MPDYQMPFCLTLTTGFFPKVSVPIKWSYVNNEQDRRHMEEEQSKVLPYFIKDSNLRDGSKRLNLQHQPASQRFKLLNMRDKEGYAVALLR